MDLEDIDLWYEDEKQRCLEDYLHEIELGKDKKKAELRYEKRIKSAIERYNLVMNDKLDLKKKSKFRWILSEIKTRLILLKK